MAAVYLRKVDSTRNMARYLPHRSRSDIFGELSVLRSWGGLVPRRDNERGLRVTQPTWQTRG